MKRLFYIALALLLSVCSCYQTNAQQLEFGLGYQQIFNRIQGLNPGLVVQNSLGDSIYFKQKDYAVVQPTLAIPVFGRITFARRIYAELSLLTARYKFAMNGNWDYSESYHNQQSMDYASFQQLAIPAGYPSDTVAYLAYLQLASRENRGEFTYREEFRLRNVSLICGYRFLLTRPVSYFLQTGLSLKSGMAQQSYQKLDVNLPFVREHHLLLEGIGTFPQNEWFFHAGAGLQSYKFRLGFFIDANLRTFRASGSKNKLVVAYAGNVIKNSLPYRDLISFGMTLSADIISVSLKDKVKGDEELKIEQLFDDKKFDKKWQLKGGISVPFFTNFNNYYPNEAVTFFDKVESFRTSPSGDAIRTDRFETVAFKQVSRSTWSPRISGEISRAFGKKRNLFVASDIHFSMLSLDYAAVYSVITMDSLNTGWALELSKSYTGSAPFRDYFNFLGMNIMGKYAIINNSENVIKIVGGVGLNARLPRLNFSDDYAREPLNVYNSIGTYAYIDGFINPPYTKYAWSDNVRLGLYALNQEFIPDFDLTADEMREILDLGLDISGTVTQPWTPNRVKPGPAIIIKTGFEVDLDKISLGVTYEQSINPVHHIFIKSYQAIFVNLGYRFLRF